MKRVVLLGAGASREAGIPLTTEMTGAIAEVISADPRAQYVGADSALNFVRGAMMGHAGAGGHDPGGPIDVEKVFSAVTLLTQRNEHEAAPFVREWHPAIASFGRRRLPAFVGDKISGALATGRSSEIERELERFVEAVIGKGDEGVYTSLLTYMIRALRQVLVIREPVDYLKPLVDLFRAQGDLAIATVNYDLTIETLASQLGCAVDTGVDRWSEIGRWMRSSESLRLLKLHGSIDWGLNTQSEKGFLTRQRIEITSDPASDPSMPAVVFGERGKLRPEGPFIELLRQFAEELEDADELVVVGFSFRDDHVNECIRTWVNADRSRRLIVVDPGFPVPYPDRERDSFRWELWANLSAEARPPEDANDARLLIYRKPASEGLPEALHGDGAL